MPDTNDTANALRRLGDFEIVRELGRGGMGVVFEAQQISLNRKVALKVLASTLGLTPRAVERFQREAEAAAKLHHTNIVPVYATGEQDGAHFYAMELIAGPSLDQVIRQMREPNQAAPSPELASTGPYIENAGSSNSTPNLSSSSIQSGSAHFDTVARMMAEVADALDYAHKQGVVHRDVKPSNLLVSPQGRLSLNDFGLARMLEQPGMTMSGEFVGTPVYMSPEQITSGRIPLDHRTDIYSLGATLYEMLTLQTPFTGERRDQVLAQIIQKEPTPPRKVNKNVPRDLETICLKALDKDPDKRYQTAGQMAEDLRRFVNRFAILAKRAGPVGRLRKWVRRHPALTAAVLLVVVATAVAGVLAYQKYQDKQAHIAALKRLEEQMLADQDRSREKLLDEKIRNAYLIATGGDLKRTDEAIKEIEDLGASTGQVRLLRGVVAYFRQDAEAAISDLEQAARLLPNNVAARALLAAAYDDNGNAERMEQRMVELQALSPSTPEDYLFRGFAREHNEPGQGLADINEGLRRGDSPLGRALRALALTNRASDSGKPEDAEQAMADADAALGMAGDNQMVLYASAYSRLIAAGLYQETNQPEKRAAALKHAARDVQALEPFVGQPNPTWVIWQYYDDLGDSDKALEVVRRALDLSPGPIPAAYGAISHYRNGEFAEAKKCLDRRPKPDLWCDGIRCFVLAELPDGPRRALDAHDELARKFPVVPTSELQLTDVLLFLGRKEQARANIKPYTEVAESQHWRDFFKAGYEYRRGNLSEDEFLAKSAASRWQQCKAHMVIGLSRLADGDRKGAREHFNKGVQTRAIWEFSWNLCQMFLSRLEKDADWPPWIPKKEDGKK